MDTVVIEDISALRAIRFARRAYRALPWHEVGRVEQRHALEGCHPAVDRIDWDELVRLGAWDSDEGEPLHVLTARPEDRRYRAGITCRVASSPLPSGALMRVRDGLYVASPAYAALRYTRGRSMPEALMLLMELLGTYTMPPEATCSLAWGGLWRSGPDEESVEQVHYRCDPVVTLHDLQVMARHAISSADSCFRTAVRCAMAGSASPGESVMAAMFGPPKRFGAFGLCSLRGGMLLNYRLDFDARALHMASGIPYAKCDAYIPAARVDIEYNGAGHEAENYRIHDGQRNNGLKGMGVTVLVINRDQMCDIVALEAIAQSIYKAARVQFRYRFDGVRLRQSAWLNGLRRGIGLPPV